MLLKEKKLQQKFKELKQRQRSRLFSRNITIEFTLNINNAFAKFNFFSDDELTVNSFDNIFSSFEYWIILMIYKYSNISFQLRMNLAYENFILFINLSKNISFKWNLHNQKKIIINEFTYEKFITFVRSASENRRWAIMINKSVMKHKYFYEIWKKDMKKL